MKLFKAGQKVELDVVDYAFGGKGIARIQTEKGNYVVFITNAIPGQKVKAKIVKARKSFSEAKLVEVLIPSPDETEIPYQPISGAPYATLPIDIQEKYKVKASLDLYKNFGKIEDPDSLMEGLISSPTTWHYRNKMEYAFSIIRYDLKKKKEIDDDFALGFKHRGTWWAVENLDHDSGLFDRQVEMNLHKIRTWCFETGLPAWHAPGGYGFFRFLTVRKSYTTNQLLISLVTTSTELEKFNIPEYVKLMQDLFGERLAGLLHVINDETGDRAQPTSGNAKVLYGENKITEIINGLEFEISMQSFFQTNPKCAEKLYSKVIEYIREGGEYKGYVMDLFCGTGTIAQLTARHLPGQQVIGVDIVEEAIEDAKINADRNNINNVKFYAADAGKFLFNFPQYREKIGTVVLDPPRGGIAPKTLQKVIQLKARVIVYVSCNPATQARDILTLKEAGYELQKFSLVDQFPHTAHVEAVALLKLISDHE